MTALEVLDHEYAKLFTEPGKRKILNEKLERVFKALVDLKTSIAPESGTGD